MDTLCMDRTVRTAMRCMWVIILLELVSANKTGPKLVAHRPSQDDPRVACALSLFHSLLADTSHITILGHAAWLNSFLKANFVPVTLLNADTTQHVIYNLMSDVTFLVTDGVGNRSFVDDTLKKLQQLDAPNMRIVVWWRTGDANYAMDAAQYLQTSRFIVVSGSTGSLQIFKMEEYCMDRSHNARAALAGECSQIDLLQKKGDLFVDLLHLDYKGCDLNISTYPDPPLRDTRKLPTDPKADFDYYELTGTHAFLAFSFAKDLNATLAVADFSHFKLEMSFNFYTTAYHVYGPAFFEGCDVILVPSGLGQEPSIFKLVHGEYPPMVWALTAVSFVVVLLLLAKSWRRHRERPVQHAALFALSVLLGNNLYARLTTNWDRIVTSSWFLSSLVLSTGYVAVLHSLQAVPPEMPDMNSLAELEQSGMHILGSGARMEAWRAAAELEDNGTLRTLGERSTLVGYGSWPLEELAWNRTIAFLCSWELWLNTVRRIEKVAGRKLIHKIPGFCTRFNRIQYLRPYQTGSRLYPALTKWMTRCLDAGLLHLLHRDSYHWPDTRQGWTPLSLHNVIVAFALLGTGLAVSTLVCCVEWIASHVDLAKYGAVLPVSPVRRR